MSTPPNGHPPGSLRAMPPSPRAGQVLQVPAELSSPPRLTSKGFGNPLLLPLPGLVILFRGSFIILRQAGLPEPEGPLSLRGNPLFLWLVRRVIQRQGLNCRRLLRAPDFCQGRKCESSGLTEGVTFTAMKCASCGMAQLCVCVCV